MWTLTRAPAAASLLASFILLPALASRAAAQAEVLTNESVTAMIAGKVPKDLIVTKIRTTKSTYDITPSGLIALNENKVPGDVIKLMMQAAGNTAKDTKETLNNDAIVQMVNGKLSRDIIVTKIQMSRPDYDLTTSGVISLNQNKVSQDVVKAMMAASSMTPPPAPPRRGAARREEAGNAAAPPRPRLLLLRRPRSRSRRLRPSRRHHRRPRNRRRPGSTFPFRHRPIPGAG